MPLLPTPNQICGNVPSPYMIDNDLTCETWAFLITGHCNATASFVENRYHHHHNSHKKKQDGSITDYQNVKDATIQWLESTETMGAGDKGYYIVYQGVAQI